MDIAGIYETYPGLCAFLGIILCYLMIGFATTIICARVDGSKTMSKQQYDAWFDNDGMLCLFAWPLLVIFIGITGSYSIFKFIIMKASGAGKGKK